MKNPVHFRKFARNRRIERQGAGGISKFLFWGEDLSGSFQGAGGVGGLVAHMEKPDSAGWTAYYYHPDANGNIAAVTSPFRALAAKFSYDAFGRTTSQSGPKSGIDIHALNYRFSTKPMELELATSNSTLVPPPVSSGLYYYGYRFYSPNLGRWISRDPIREQGGRNLYNFVGNDGVGKIDKLGKKECPCISPWTGNVYGAVISPIWSFGTFNGYVSCYLADGTTKEAFVHLRAGGMGLGAAVGQASVSFSGKYKKDLMGQTTVVWSVGMGVMGGGMNGGGTGISIVSAQVWEVL